jgi:copper(I)-binding protein
MTRMRIAAVAFFCVSLPGVSYADQIRVTEAWTRAGVPGQKVAGIYFDILSTVDAKLVAVDTAVARVAELHLMSVENGTMRMRAVRAIDLPAGQTVRLKPGGYHVMLFDLTRSLEAGERIPIQLSVEDVNGMRTRLEIGAEVRNIDGSKLRDHD